MTKPGADFILKLDLPNLNLTKHMVNVCKRVILPDINERMLKGVDVNERPYAPLATSTKKARNRKGHGFQILKDSGQLRSSFKVLTTGVNVILIKPLGGRRNSTIGNNELADILQNQGVRSKTLGLRKFEFFKISKQAEYESLKFMEKVIKTLILRGGRRITKQL